MRLDIHTGFKNENNIMCITRSKQRGKNQNFFEEKLLTSTFRTVQSFKK